MMAYTGNSIVQGCYIHDSNKGGCYFYCEDDGIVQHIDNNIMRNNTVVRTMTSGLSISLRGLEDIGQYDLIENNTCIDCGRDGEHPGINLGWSSGSSAPIRYANHCTVQYNLVYETGVYNCGGGLLMQCMNSLIRNNVVNNTADVAACIRGNYNIFINNHLTNVRNQGYPGLEIWDGNNNNILNNVISNIKSHGILIVTYGLTSGCNNNDINGNTISGVAEYWVVISNAGSRGNIIELNTFVGAKSIYNVGTGTIIRNNK